MKNNFLGLFLLIIISSVFAQDQRANSSFCGLNAPQPDVVIPSNEVSGNYWTNMLDDNTVMFTAEGGTAGEYQAYDLLKRKAYKLTDEIDPFPVPDGRRIYVHPGPIQFFEFDEILKRVAQGEDQTKLVEEAGHSPRKDRIKRKKYEKYENDEDADEDDENEFDEKKDEFGIEKDFEIGDVDGRMWGYYESVAVLESHKSLFKNYSIYRILTGEEEGTFKDYKVKFTAEGRIAKVTSQSKAKVMCPNWRTGNTKVDLDFDTPILSPKGDEFGITNRATGTTQIIKFDGITGHCSVAMDLGFEAGKIHFNADGSKIAFHSQNINVGAVKSVTVNNRGYLLDRKSNTIVSLQMGDVTESTAEQYPAFLSDGRIIYQRVKFNSLTGKQSRAWVIVDPNKLNSAVFKKLPNKFNYTNDNNLPLIALASLYSNTCGSVNADDSLMWTLNMDPLKCQNLVSAEWENQKSSILEKLNTTSFPKISEDTINKEMLLSACPKKKVGEIITLQPDVGVAMKYPAIIAQRCVVCHLPNSPRGYIPFDKPEKLRTMQAFGKSSEAGGPFEKMTFTEQIEGILNANEAGKILPSNVPKVPADGPRLNRAEIDEIINWVKKGTEVIP